MRVGAVMALALACSWPLPLLAAEDAAPNALVRQGAELFKQQDYEGARAAFARAYALDPKATTLFNLALSELNSDHPVEAARDLRDYLTHSEEPVTVTTLFARDVFTLLEKIGPVVAASSGSKGGTDSRFRFRATAGVGKREPETTVYRDTVR